MMPAIRHKARLEDTDMGNNENDDDANDVDISGMGVEPDEEPGGDSDGLDLSGMATSVEEESSSSGSSGSSGSKRSGKRGNVIIEGRYGSIVLPPDTTCQRCGRKAEGALAMETGGSSDGANLVKEMPLCRNHREQFEQDNPASWEEYDYYTF